MDDMTGKKTLNWLELANPLAAALLPYEPGQSPEDLWRARGVRDAIKLASNENPRGPSAAVGAALGEAWKDLNRYPDNDGIALGERICELQSVAMNQVVFGNGSSELLFLLASAFLGPGRNAIIDQYGFMIYPSAVSITGALLRVAQADPGYRMDLSAVLDLVDEDTRLIFIANPGNPTGTWLSADALESFLASLPRNILVALDEAYYEYAVDKGAASGIELMRAHENLVVLRTFSKVYGLAGVRIGYCVAHPEVIDMLNRVRDAFNTSTLAQAVALAALADESYVTESVALNAAGLQFLQAGLEAMGVEYIPSATNFLTMAVGQGDAAPIHDALLDEGVIVRPIKGYGLPGHLRVSIGLEEENVRFLEALGKVLGKASTQARAAS